MRRSETEPCRVHRAGSSSSFGACAEEDVEARDRGVAVDARHRGVAFDWPRAEREAAEPRRRARPACAGCAPRPPRRELRAGARRRAARGQRPGVRSGRAARPAVHALGRGGSDDRESSASASRPARPRRRRAVSPSRCRRSSSGSAAGRAARQRRSAQRAAERREQVAALEAAQPEQQVRIAVDLLAEQVVDRRDVLAGIRGVGTRARGLEVAVRAREEREAAAARTPASTPSGIWPEASVGGELGIAGELLRHLLPVGAREHREAHAHEIRCVARALHLRGDEALADLELEHLTLTCVEAAATEPAADLEALEHLDPAPRPPVLGAAAAALPRALRAAVRAAASALARRRGRGSVRCPPPRALLAARRCRSPCCRASARAARRSMVASRGSLRACVRGRSRLAVARSARGSSARVAGARSAVPPWDALREVALRPCVIGPPGPPDRRRPAAAAAAAGVCAAVRSPWPIAALASLIAHSRTASLRSANMSCSSSFESSVIHASPRADDVLGERALALDHLVDALLERAGADELVHLHVARLADAEGAVGGLVLDGRVPPAVEVEDVVRAGQVEAECRPP